MSLMPPDAAALTSAISRALTAGYLVTMMFSMGLELGAAPAENKQAKRLQRRLLLRALVINLVLLPLVAFALMRLYHLSGVVAVALLLLAATPGGRFAPQLTKLARGELALSVEIGMFLIKLTPFTAPLTVKWMLGGHKVELHELRMIAALLVLQLGPYLFGKWLQRRRPALAGRLYRPVWMLAALFVAALVALLVAHHELRSVVLLPAGGWAAVLSLALLSLALAWLFGGPTPQTRRALAVSVNARDLALALLIGSLAYPRGGVQLVILALWLVLLVFNLVFASLAGRARPDATRGRVAGRAGATARARPGGASARGAAPTS